MGENTLAIVKGIAAEHEESFPVGWRIKMIRPLFLCQG